MQHTQEAAMWIFNPYLDGPVVSVTEARIVLPAKTTEMQEGYQTSYYGIVNYLIKRYATDDSIVMVDAEIRIFKYVYMAQGDYSRELLTNTLRFGSVYIG